MQILRCRDGQIWGPRPPAAWRQGDYLSRRGAKEVWTAHQGNTEAGTKPNDLTEAVAHTMNLAIPHRRQNEAPGIRTEHWLSLLGLPRPEVP